MPVRWLFVALVAAFVGCSEHRHGAANQQISVEKPVATIVDNPVVDDPVEQASARVVPFNADLCLVDASRDGFLDIALWSGGWDNSRIVVVDGRTGRGLWSSPRLPHMADSFLHCADSSTVIVGLQDFTVRAFEATSGRMRWRVMMTDIPEQSAAGDGCIRVRSKDGTETGLSLSTGAEQPCRTETEPSNYVRRTALRVFGPFAAAGLAVTLTERQQGTPMLTLTATKDGAQAWQQALGIASDIPHAIFGNAIAYSDRAIVVGGREPAGSVSLLGISPTTGDQIWKRTYGQGAAILFVLGANDRFYAGADGSVRAIDPLTGRDVWTARL